MKIVYNFCLPYIFHVFRNERSYLKFVIIKDREGTSVLFKCQVQFLQILRLYIMMRETKEKRLMAKFDNIIRKGKKDNNYISGKTNTEDQKR